MRRGTVNDREFWHCAARSFGLHHDRGLEPEGTRMGAEHRTGLLCQSYNILMDLRSTWLCTSLVAGAEKRTSMRGSGNVRKS